MGERTVMQEALCYGFSLEQHVPTEAEQGDKGVCIAEHLGCRVGGRSTEERDQQVISVALFLAEISRTRVGCCSVGRCKSIRRNQRNTVGEPQFDFLAVMFRGLRQ